MKKLILLLSVSLVITSFTTNNKTDTSGVRYAFITDTERDKTLDTPENNGYVDITTNIVRFYCDLDAYKIEYQYIQHYEAEEKTENRDRAFIGSSGITSAWIYNSYVEALSSRRDWMAKKNSKYKRRIERFYITCN